jgi:hypothetical protein
METPTNRFDLKSNTRAGKTTVDFTGGRHARAGAHLAAPEGSLSWNA